MKRIISIILLLALFATTLVGCNESAPEPDVTTKNPAPETTSPSNAPLDTEPSEKYVVNANNGKFHLPDCTYAQKISEANREEYSLSYDKMIADGYTPCGHCLASQGSATEAPGTTVTPDVTVADTSAAPTETTEEPTVTTVAPQGELHILNTGTKKIHKPDCRYADNKNREEYTGDVNDLLEEGYTLCKTCHKD
jgi:hypothetical protein